MNWNHAVLGLNICLIGESIPYNMSKIVKFSSIREPVKKKNVENSTFGGGGVRTWAFSTFKKKVVFKMHFQPF